eukprot:CAMPEP_0113316116 /NCGR_PEP_ID=MMETSP0010_2-20120614/11508_1 /TAXON_ID=216773 ORGANISM="Corethron hystrix, Strain 308" /NCGR_SAMPLE_ID=MMETSP0010_2 /ASSEMBLY_ACC=CAM_ASM_000155 /LENGTH=145 /DNA_ID=CAMNT_0000172743 /DNA_START=196 /DNA_END=633 /DNA_ORIENTATION=+ /assembly_acc=CAM_ASM_000155
MNDKLSLTVPDQELLRNLEANAASNPDATFAYAFALTRSDDRKERDYALSMLENLLDSEYKHQTDCVYGMATALYLNGKYAHARTKCEAILRSEPDNSNAEELHLACVHAQDERKRKEDIAIGGGVAMAGVGLALGLLGMMVRKK